MVIPIAIPKKVVYNADINSNQQRNEVIMKHKNKTLIYIITLSLLMAGCANSMDTNTPIQNNNYVYDEAMGIAQDFSVVEMEPSNTEEYSEFVENNFKSAKENPLSTFSIDVDTASYTNIRRFLNDNTLPPNDAVRAEEIINFFKYDYEKPTDENPVSINTEISDCPWNENTKLLLVGLKSEEIDLENLPNSNIVFLIDVSGSMNSADKLPLVQSAFEMLTNSLSENDRISIVTYASSDAVLLDGATGNEQSEILDIIYSLSSGGSTAGSRGILTAYEIAEKHFIEGGNNCIILATDGDLNVGLSSEDELKALVEEKRDNGIMLSVLGFGTGNIKDNKMEVLADNGNGSYHYIDSKKEAERVLVDEMGGTLFTVAKDVKLQLEFNPETVKGYRLVGYENRLLANEDFEDDTKDAGEIGSGMTVTALYEIALSDSAQEIPKTESDTDFQSELESDDLMSVNLRYKPLDSDESKLMTHSVKIADISDTFSRNFTLASCAAEYSMLLRNSSFVGSSSFEYIIDKLGKIQSEKNDEYVGEFIELCKKAQNLKK